MRQIAAGTRTLSRPCCQRRHIAYQPISAGSIRFAHLTTAHSPDPGSTGHHARSRHLMGPHQPLLTPVTPGWGHARQHSLEEGNNERQSRSD